jgi:hypothetical protein
MIKGHQLVRPLSFYRGFSAILGHRIAAFIDSEGEPEVSAKLDRQTSATSSVSFLSLPTEGVQDRLPLCFAPLRSDVVRNLVPRFNRSSTITSGLLPSALAV